MLWWSHHGRVSSPVALCCVGCVGAGGDVLPTGLRALTCGLRWLLQIASTLSHGLACTWLVIKARPPFFFFFCICIGGSVCAVKLMSKYLLKYSPSTVSVADTYSYQINYSDFWCTEVNCYHIYSMWGLALLFSGLQIHLSAQCCLHGWQSGVKACWCWNKCTHLWGIFIFNFQFDSRKYEAAQLREETLMFPVILFFFFFLLHALLNTNLQFFLPLANSFFSVQFALL